MGKVCVFPGCTSGSRAERKEKAHKGIRKTSLFGVPKCPQRRQLWSIAAGLTLLQIDDICELHFRQDDIVREYVVPMFDGTTYSCPLEKPRLKKTALPVPLVEENDDPLRVDQSSQSSNLQVFSENPCIKEEIADITIEEVNIKQEYIDIVEHHVEDNSQENY